MVCRALLPVAAALLAIPPGPALAQGGSDPPDEPASRVEESAKGDSSAVRQDECNNGWFCEPGPAKAPATPVTPPSEEAGSAEPSQAQQPPRAASEPRPAPEDVSSTTRAQKPLQRQHGLLGRLGGSYLGRGSTERTPFMAGIGAAFRMRPLPHFALDFAVDAFRGRDFLGALRTEGGLSVTTQLFFNPEHRYAVYLPAGLFHTWARVKPIAQPGRHYRYVGAFLGLGVERSIDEHFAAFADAVGFIRGRSDARVVNEPEFVDLDSGKVTNSSGGALIRIGAAYYF